MNIKIIGAKKFDFEDKVTKKQVAGMNLYYTAEDPFDDQLMGLMSGKISLGQKASTTLNVSELLNAKECQADFNQYGKLISIKPVF